MKFTKEHYEVMDSMERRITRLAREGNDLRDRVGKLEHESVTVIRSGEVVYRARSHRVSVRYLVWLILDHLGLEPIHVEESTKLEKKSKASKEIDSCKSSS